MSSMSRKRVDAKQNQIFIGCPWKTIRTKYDRIVIELHKKYPVYFTIVGRDDRQEADDLLEVIKTRILSSTFAIFDATYGNANVSLEYGFAEAHDIPRMLTLNVHGSSKKNTEESAIISDLAGKRRNQYTNESALKTIIEKCAKSHNYTKRFEAFMNSRSGGKKRKTRHYKKKLRSLSIKIIHELDGRDSVKRAELIQNLQAKYQAYKMSEMEEALKLLHNFGLVNVEVGRYPAVRIA